jgi:hypothetical protein
VDEEKKMISERDLGAYFIRNGEDNVYQLSSYCQAPTVTFRRVADGHEVHCAESSALEIEFNKLIVEKHAKPEDEGATEV